MCSRLISVYSTIAPMSTILAALLSERTYKYQLTKPLNTILSNTNTTTDQSNSGLSIGLTSKAKPDSTRQAVNAASNTDRVKKAAALSLDLWWGLGVSLLDIFSIPRLRVF